MPLPALIDSDGLIGYDTQLKILQILPQLLQQYPDNTVGDTFAKSLQICSALSSSKATGVSGTASATLQQLVVTAFDRVAEEDSTCRTFRYIFGVDERNRERTSYTRS